MSGTIGGSSTDALRVARSSDFLHDFGGGIGGGGEFGPLCLMPYGTGTSRGYIVLGLIGLPLPSSRSNKNPSSSSLPSDGKESSPISSSSESSKRSSYSPYNASCPLRPHAGRVRFVRNVVGSNSVLSLVLGCKILRPRLRNPFERFGITEIPMLFVPTEAVGDPVLLLKASLGILVGFRGEADDRESEEPRDENGRCKGSGIAIERVGELDLVNGADVGAVECVAEAARRGDLDFAPIPNMLIDENKGAPEEEDDRERRV